MPYRNERLALEDRASELRLQLETLAERSRVLVALAADRDARVRELAAIETRLANLSQRRSLPQLSDMQVASPCTASWAAMDGNDRVRFCGECKKNVYNLSAMAAAEANAVIVETEGKLCVRFFRRADGSVLTADCPVGVKRKRRRRALVATTAGVLAAAGAAWATASQGGVEGARIDRVAKIAPCAVMGGPQLPHEEVTGQAVAPPQPEVMGRLSHPRSPVATLHQDRRGHESR